MTQIPDIYDAAAAYDRQLLDETRELCNLHTPTAMRNYLANREGFASEADNPDVAIPLAAVFGILQGYAGELVRWLERIPEANRG